MVIQKLHENTAGTVKGRAEYYDVAPSKKKKPSYGTLRHAVWYNFTDVSDEHAASIFKLP
jgi:hypothetical protein